MRLLDIVAPAVGLAGSVHAWDSTVYTTVVVPTYTTYCPVRHSVTLLLTDESVLTTCLVPYHIRVPQHHVHRYEANNHHHYQYGCHHAPVPLVIG